jgi:hypothetical protein
MNAGVTEEVGKATNSAIDALKSTPVILAILIFNIAWMGIIGWSAHENGSRWERTIDMAFKYCPANPHDPSKQ